MLSAVQDVAEENKDLVRKYHKEMKLRKKYHNELVELKGRHMANDVTAKKRICLLYTSPSPRDISGSRMPSSA